MVDGNIHLDVVTGIITTLRNNISDPNSSRNAGDVWIYPNFPRKNAQMPRISVTPIPAGSADALDIGSTMSQHNIRLQVDIWCATKGKFTISGTSYGNTHLADYLAGQVTKVLFQQRHSLSAYNILTIDQIHPFGFLDADDEQLVREMSEFEVMYINTYT